MEESMASVSRLLSPECVPVEDQRLINFAVMTGTMLPVGRTVRQYSEALTAPRKSANSYGLITVNRLTVASLRNAQRESHYPTVEALTGDEVYPFSLLPAPEILCFGESAKRTPH